VADSKKANPVLETPPKITLGITEACPLRCRYCYADCARNPKPGELSAIEWVRVISELAERGIVHAYIEGGEPLIKPGFLEILRNTSPVMMTMLRTHGWGLSRGMAGRLADSGLARCFVDLMGDSAEVHDRASGVAGSFAKSVAAIGHLVAAGIPADVLVILTRQTAPLLPAIARLAAGLGAERLGVLRLYPLGRARAQWNDIAIGLPPQMEALAAVRAALPAGLGLMQSWHPEDHNCCWQSAAINAFGRAIGCMYLRDYVDFGDATRTPYDQIFRDNALYRELRSGNVEESCGACSATQSSHGGCRSTAYAWHGRWSAPDPFDQPLNGGIDLTVLPPERPRAGGGDAQRMDG
jgi:radical SAM protein with 4Fe4S-binding SPASM domain